MATRRQAQISLIALVIGLLLLLALVYRPSPTTFSPPSTVSEQPPATSSPGLDPNAGRIAGPVFETIPEGSLEAGLPQLMVPGQPMPHSGYYARPAEEAAE